MRFASRSQLGNYQLSHRTTSLAFRAGHCLKKPCVWTSVLDKNTLYNLVNTSVFKPERKMKYSRRYGLPTSTAPSTVAPWSSGGTAHGAQKLRNTAVGTVQLGIRLTLWTVTM